MQGKKYNVHNIIQLGGSIFLKDLIFNFVIFFLTGSGFERKFIINSNHFC